MLSSDFHFSAEYLEEGSTIPEYAVSDMTTLGFEIYNYEKSNVALRSGTEVSFRFQCKPAASVTIQNENGDKIVADDGVFTIPKETENKIWYAKVATGANEAVTVKLETVSPYKLVLQAKFTSDTVAPAYSIEDKGNYRVLTIKSNSYEGQVDVEWNPADLSPDNTNPLMEDWKDASPIGTFTAEKNHVYALIFVENKSKTAASQTGTGKSIEIK